MTDALLFPSFLSRSVTAFLGHAHAIALALVWRSAHAHYNIYQIEIDVQFFKRLYRFDSFENLSCRKLNFIFLFFLLCSTIFLINFCLSHHKLTVDATLTNKYSFISITYTAVPVLVHHRLSSVGIGHSLPSPRMVLGSELSSDTQWHRYPFESLAVTIWRIDIFPTVPTVILSTHFNFHFKNNFRISRRTLIVRESSRKPSALIWRTI